MEHAADCCIKIHLCGLTPGKGEKGELMSELRGQGGWTTRLMCSWCSLSQHMILDKLLSGEKKNIYTKTAELKRCLLKLAERALNMPTMHIFINELLPKIK